MAFGGLRRAGCTREHHLNLAYVLSGIGGAIIIVPIGIFIYGVAGQLALLTFGGLAGMVLGGIIPLGYWR
jgi:hypothetical protein